eukprot:gene10535-7492_t
MSSTEKQSNKAQKMSSVISDLLGQSTSGVPILAGRKTATMKQLEEKKRLKKELVLKKLENRRKIESKIPSTNAVNVDFERQLRRLATKGVVALFNAVAKSKRDGSKAASLLKNASTLPLGGPGNPSSAIPLEERSVGSDVSSITANNSIIHRSKSNPSTHIIGKKRPLSAESAPAKSQRKQVSEGWDKDMDDDL